MAYICIPSSYFSVISNFHGTVVSLASLDELKPGSWLVLFDSLGTRMELKHLRTRCLVIKSAPSYSHLSLSSMDPPMRDHTEILFQLLSILGAAAMFVILYCLGWEGQKEESFRSWSSWLYTLLLTSQLCWRPASIRHTFIKMFYWAPT